MTKDSMQMQNTYFSAVEGFRQFIRNSVRTKQDHYKWVDLYSEKSLDDPNPKVVEIQDEKAEQLAVTCATLAYLTLSVYYGRNKFADTTFAELEGEDYSKFLRQAHYEMADEHGQFGIFGWDGLITQIAKDCMPDKCNAGDIYGKAKKTNDSMFSACRNHHRDSSHGADGYCCHKNHRRAA